MSKIKNSLIWMLRKSQIKAFLSLMADTSSQIEKFNAIWMDAVANIPFYAEWKVRNNLPEKIVSLKELSEWPILEKQDLILNYNKLVRKDVKKFHESVTGGATGEPLHFRTMPGESDVVSANKWIGWARMGIYPDSRCFLLWGHRHFYGQGLISDLRFKWRQIKDWMTNNIRVDATDLSQVALRRDVKRLIQFKPECIIAYSASLLALVRTCEEYRSRCQELRIKGIICTAGPLTMEEQLEIKSFFNAPVSMEYGSMECGVMAYKTKTTCNRYKVFNNTHILHAVQDFEPDRYQILVTTLTTRYLPLIRYRVGDYMEDPVVLEDKTVVDFKDVTGRTGDMIDLGNGVRFHGYSLMVCAEANSKIIAYQVKVSRSKRKIKFVAQTLLPLSMAERKNICKHASHVAGISPEIIDIEESRELIKAPSGKIRLVIDID